MYAIVEAGGKQYRVEKDSVIAVEKLEAQVGDKVELDRVLLVNQDGDLQVGTPVVEGAKVVCQVLEQGRGPKIRVFTYKAKKNYSRRIGHRQSYSRLLVEDIKVSKGGSRGTQKRDG